MRSWRMGSFVLLMSSLGVLSGCERGSPDGPPEVRLGDSMCAECGMIISDERWVTSTIIEGDRGAEPLLFDDFNCQSTHEYLHPEFTVIARWSRDHGTLRWIRTEEASFVTSPRLRTPMASHAAAFASEAGALAMQAELGGDVLAFEAIWPGLMLPGVDTGAAVEVPGDG